MQNDASVFIWILHKEYLHYSADVEYKKKDNRWKYMQIFFSAIKYL